MSASSHSSARSFFESDWLSQSEGQLAVDVLETPSHLRVRSAIAGVRAEDLEITLSDDTLTIRGTRHLDTKPARGERVHVQECHWGSFSRSILLPAHVDADHVDATFQRGILTITLKKLTSDGHIPILDLGDL